MNTMLHQIKDRSRLADIEFATLEHFTLDDGKTTSAQRLIDERCWSPYCVNLEKRYAVFVDLPPELDIAQSVFSHLTQYHNARQAMIVPLDDLLALSSQVSPPPKILFQFNIGRSGTTLLNKVINQVDGVWSLSEPDIYGGHYIANANDFDQDELVALIRVCTGLLFRPPPGRLADTLGVKFRSQGLFTADIFYRAFPDARYFFSYRDALSWANSFYKLAERIGRPPFITDDEQFVRLIWQILSANSDFSYTEPYFDIASAVAHPELVYAPCWTLHCELYTKHLEAGVPFFAFRYNELNTEMESVIAQLLEHCGLPAESLSQALKGFEGDAQEGTDIARSVRVKGFTDEQYERLRRTLAKHPRFNDPDLLLPDIYRPRSGI